MNRFSDLLSSGRVAIAGGKVPAPEGVGPIPNLVERVTDLLTIEARFALLRASAVCSPLHLLAAVQGAWQGLSEGTAAARDLGGETARFLAAERQVGQALNKVGLLLVTKAVAMVLILPEEEANARAGKDSQVEGTDGEAYVSTLTSGEVGAPEALGDESPAGKVLRSLIRELGWERNDELLSGVAFGHAGFGLASEVLESTPRARWENLVLARCALVPLLK